MANPNLMYQKIRRIAPDIADIPTTTAAMNRSWPSVSPIINKGVVEYNAGAKYNLDVEGLYVAPAFQHKYYYPNQSNPTVTYEPYHGYGNLIVVDPTNPDPYAFLAAFCRLTGYGGSDAGLTLAQRKWEMRRRILFLQCGDTSTLLVDMLQGLGFQARCVHLVGNFTEDNRNYLSEGHVCVEYRRGTGPWHMVDPSRDIYFKNGGVHLSAKALYDLGATNADEVVRLAPFELTQGEYVGTSNSTVIQAGPPTTRNRCYFPIRHWVEANLLTDEDNRQFEDDVFYSYGWAHTNGEVWYLLGAGATQAHIDYLTGLSTAYKVKTWAQIEAVFYPA